jgi:hypothetical protein
VLGFTLALSGCGYDNDDGEVVYPEVAEADIDLNGFFEPVEPGQGVGVFVEYGPDGHWRIFTSCDTSNPAGPGTVCPWEVYVALAEGSSVRTFQTETLEGTDWVFWDGPGNGTFVAYTGSDLDGFSFETDAGQPLRIWAYLDGLEANPYINWIAGGAVVEGAATHPIDLLPALP